MQELDLTWNRTMRVWWLFAWRMATGGAIIGFLFGFIGGVVAVFTGRLEDAGTFGAVLGYLGGVAWSPFVVRMMLRKKYSDFRFALIPISLADDYPQKFETGVREAKWR